ncbi:endonuclease/exonuclease/phosphatase family protein [Verrucomicrobiales bacterium BCK34]|nr:endonuclease/exonuclease/phosphatase family protein [Verrucomicrobiales bacterium BCK34]
MSRRLLTLLLSALLVLLVTFLFHRQHEAPISGKPLPILQEGTSILSWNLQWFPGNKQKSDAEGEREHISEVASKLIEADADILCLQEVKGHLAINRLLEKLPGYQMQVASDFRGPQELAILSKKGAMTAFAEEFTKAEFTPPRGFVHAAFDYDGKRLLVYSVHFKSNFGGIGMNIPKREEAARQLLKHVKDSTKLHLVEGAESVSVVLCGDFNTSLLTETFQEEKTGRIILDSGFEWGFRGLPESESITWLSDGRYPDVTFDHFFVQGGNGVIVGRSVVLPTERRVSDHRPVLMRLRVN